MIRIAIHHSEPLVRGGLVQVLGAEDDIDVVVVASTPDVLERRCARAQPDAVVLEINPDRWCCCALATRLRRNLSVRVVGLLDDALGDDPSKPRLVYHAVVKTSAGIGPLLDALRGGTPLEVRAGSCRAQPCHGAACVKILSYRQLQVLELLSAGLTAREVSDRLGITEKTVNTHTQRIFSRLGVQSKAHAVAVALRLGMLDDLEPAGVA